MRRRADGHALERHQVRQRRRLSAGRRQADADCAGGFTKVSPWYVR